MNWRFAELASSIAGSGCGRVLLCERFAPHIETAGVNTGLCSDHIERCIHNNRAVIESLNYEALSRLTIGLPDSVGSSNMVPAYARFPVVVRRSSSRLVARLTATSLGALLVASPAILGSGTPLPIRIVSALSGAALLAMASIVLSSVR